MKKKITNYLKALSGILITILLASCTINTANISQNQELKSDEGIIIVRLKQMPWQSVLTIHKGVGFPYASFSSEGSEIRVIPIKSGSLRLSTLTTGNDSRAYFEDRYNFEVEPGTITYIGDVYVHSSFKSVALEVRDYEFSTVNVAKEKYPWLFNRYPYKKSIVRPPLKKD